jgi:N-acetylglutamate synthase-like GNAT family acetyltransferase
MRSKGFGKMLVQAVIDYAKENGTHEVATNFVVHADAEKICQRFGFAKQADGLSYAKQPNEKALAGETIATVKPVGRQPTSGGARPQP